MLKKEISAGIIQYAFGPKEGQHFGNNVTALIHEDKVLLVDVGYEDQAQEVIEDLNVNNLEIDKVIISHFHDDHMQGLKVVSGVSVYGSSSYKNSLDRWTPKEDHKYFTPTILVEGTLKITFGRHEIEMIGFPGHSLCTILVKVNDEFIHVADELMFSTHGEPLLPSTTRDGVYRHLQSINRLRDYADYTFILSHGDSIKDKVKIENAIDNASSYLSKIASNSDRISFEKAVEDCDCTFLHQEWHEYMYR